MQPVSVVAIFCEDIREEKSGQDTIVGILPDNLTISAPVPSVGTALIPKLGLYLRVHFDVKDRPKGLSIRLLSPSDNVVAQSEWQQSVIDKAFDDSAANKMPLVGLIQKLVASPFPVPQAGKIIAIATINGSDYVAGALNVIFPSATASAPPAEQS
jgi:hypothetical protein